MSSQRNKVFVEKALEWYVRDRETINHSLTVKQEMSKYNIQIISLLKGMFI